MTALNRLGSVVEDQVQLGLGGPESLGPPEKFCAERKSCSTKYGAAAEGLDDLYESDPDDGLGYKDEQLVEELPVGVGLAHLNRGVGIARERLSHDVADEAADLPAAVVSAPRRFTEVPWTGAHATSASDLVLEAVHHLGERRLQVSVDLDGGDLAAVPAAEVVGGICHATDQVPKRLAFVGVQHGLFEMHRLSRHGADRTEGVGQ